MAEAVPAAGVAGCSRRARKRRIWTALAVLAAVALLFVLPYLRGQHHFSDPLFARYYELVASQKPDVDRGLLIGNLARMFHIDPPASLAPDVNVDLIRDWETEYGDDPRYWELRASSLGCDADVLNAFKRGVFSEGMLEAANTWEVYSANPALALTLCDKAIAADPQNSYWCYRKSDLVFTQGDKAAAFALVQQGNAAARNLHPRPYPMSYVLADHNWVRTHTDKFVAGFSTCSWMSPVSGVIKDKKIARVIKTDLANGADPTFADAYYIRYVRQGEMDSIVLLEILVNVVQVLITECDKEQPICPLSAAQQSEFDEYITARNGISREIVQLARKKYRKEYTKAFEIPNLSWQEEWHLFIAGQDERARIAANFGKLLPAPFAIWKSGGLTGFKLDPKLKALADEAAKERAESRKAK
jgi:hypothetical protein